MTVRGYHPATTLVFNALRFRFSGYQIQDLPQKHIPKTGISDRIYFARCHLAVSRRIFLHHGVLAAVACAASPVFALGSQRSVGGSEDTGALPRQPSTGGSNNWQDHSAALQGMSRGQFAGVVGTNFKVILPDNAQPVWITLQAIEDLPEIAPVNSASFAVPIKQSAVAPVAPTTNGFLLKFGGSTPVAQGTYLLEHDSLGPFALFIVPAGSGVYTAVINRLNAPTIIAVPFAAGTGTGSAAKTVAPAGVVTAPVPASTRVGNQSPDLSGSRGVQRSVVRD